MKKKGEARMLVATMHSDWVSVDLIHGKCTIEHKDDIVDFESFKLLSVSTIFQRVDQLGHILVRSVV